MLPDVSSCEKFLETSRNLVTHGLVDQIVGGVSGEATVDFANHLTVNSVSGRLNVLSAISVDAIQGVSGQLFMRAQDVGSIEGISGELCLSAESVRTLNSVSGTSRVKVPTMNSLTVLSGTVHLYGTIVQRVDSNSGKICLHDGAKILNQSQFSGEISESCSSDGAVLP